MEMGRRTRRLQPARIQQKLSVFHFLFSLFLMFLLIGCASPGEPVERRPPTPAAVTDLTALQTGNSVALTFTLPRETADHRPLKEAPAVDIWRSFSSSSSSAPSPAELATIPSAMVSRYMEQGRVRYVDVLRPEVFTQHANDIAHYTVRTRVSEKKLSPESNVVAVQIHPAPDPIEDLKGESQRSGVTLTWTPPQRTPVGPAPPVEMYRVYRTEIATPSAESSPTTSAVPESPVAKTPTKLKEEFAKIAEVPSPAYEDTQTEYGKTYTYSVRSVVRYSGHDLESSDSNLVTIARRDIFPPSVPQGLVVVFVPALGETPAHLELSWAINPETDIGGYNVYRSEQGGTLGTRLNSETLLTPAFRDMSAIAGRHYFYAVTAVDRSGNESSPSAPVAGEMPAESQQP